MAYLIDNVCKDDNSFDRKKSTNKLNHCYNDDLVDIFWRHISITNSQNGSTAEIERVEILSEVIRSFYASTNYPTSSIVIPTSHIDYQ
jgi:hypothetical protein